MHFYTLMITGHYAVLLDTATDSDAGGMHKAYLRPGVLRCKAVRGGGAGKGDHAPHFF